MHIGENEHHEWMKQRIKGCEHSEGVHIIMASFPQPHPAATIPLSDSGPSVLWSYLFNPNEDCA